MYSFQSAVLILKINVFIDVYHHIYIYIYICTHSHTNMISTHIELLEAEEVINTIYTMIAPSKIITVTMIIIIVLLTPHFFLLAVKEFFSRC